MVQDTFSKDTSMIFQDRKEAGQILSSYLAAYKNQKDVVVLGLARGGVVVAYEIAKALSLPCNVIVPRKLGAPGQPELAIGALAEDGTVFLNADIVDLVGASPTWIDQEIESQKKLIQQRLALYRRVAPLKNLEGKIILLVDDGIATGATMLVQIQALKKKGVKKIVAISPVSSADAWHKIKALADEAVCPYVLEDFLGVSSFYREFDQVEDEMILALLQKK